MSNNLFSGVFPLLMPHVIVIVGVVIAALWNLFFPKKKMVTPVVSVIALLLAGLAYINQLSTITSPVQLFANLYTGDALSMIFGLLSCAVGVLVVLMTMGYERKFGPNRGEFYAILLTATASVMFLAGTTDLVMLFVALETLTVCCVILAGMNKQDVKSNEASLKYLLSTAATTATFMYGLTFLYGLTGSTNFYEIQSKFLQVAQSPSLVAVLLVVLLISVIGFKLSIVPFHMWTPDVYEGAPTPVTAFLSIGSKLGGVVVALRLMTFVFGNTAAAPIWVPIISLLAILSMIGGNFMALCQTSVKRMLAYSSIAHVGYFLIAFAANSTSSLTSMVFYVMVYGLMNLGAFAAAIMIENEVGSDNMNDWAGIIRKRPFVTLAMAVCLMNLGGLPVPPAGFLAKFFVFWSGIKMYSTPGNILVIVGLLTSVPALFYYTRVAINMIVKEPSLAVDRLPAQRRPGGDSQFGPILALSIVLIGIIASSTTMITPMMAFSERAIRSLNAPDLVGSLPAKSTVSSLPQTTK